jgi:hypothetical protein
MPIQQMAEVVKQMSDRFGSEKKLDAEKAERLRRLADQLVAATSRISGAMSGGTMGGGMMGQGTAPMAEVSQLLAQMSDLLGRQ